MGFLQFISATEAQWSSGMRCHVLGCVVTDVSKEHNALFFRVKQSSTCLGWLDPDNKGSVLLQNSRNNKPSDTTRHHIPSEQQEQQTH